MAFVGIATIDEPVNIVTLLENEASSTIPRTPRFDENNCTLRSPNAFAGYAIVNETIQVTAVEPSFVNTPDASLYVIPTVLAALIRFGNITLVEELLLIDCVPAAFL